MVGKGRCSKANSPPHVPGVSPTSRDAPQVILNYTHAHLEPRNPISLIGGERLRWLLISCAFGVRVSGKPGGTQMSSWVRSKLNTRPRKGSARLNGGSHAALRGFEGDSEVVCRV